MMSMDPLARLWPRFLAAALGLAALASAAVGTRVSERASDPLALVAALERETGLRVRGVTSLEPAFWPSPGLRAHDVSLSGDGVLREAEISALTVHLSLLDLLIGRLRVGAVTIEGARVLLDTSRRVAPSVRAAAARGRRRLDTVRMRDLTLRLAGPGAALGTLRLPEADLHWRDADAPASLVGRVAWRDIEGSAALWVQSPVDLWNGRTSVILARLTSTALTFNAQGEYAEGLGYRGYVSARSDDLRALEASGMVETPLLRNVSKAKLRADVALTHHGASFTAASIGVGPDIFEGSMTLRRDEGRPSLSATLAAAKLNLTPWLGAVPRLLTHDAHGERVWSRVPLAVGEDARLDLDLRVSAAQLSLGRYKASDVALAVLLKRGRFDLTVSDANGYGGAARGRLSLGPKGGRLEARGALQLSDVDLSQLPRQGAARTRLRGVVSGQLSFDAYGDDVAQMAAHLDGRLVATLREGEIAGLDLEHVLRRPSRLGSVIVRTTMARTSFDAASLSLRATGGVAMINDASLSGPGVVANARGAIDLARLTASLRLEAAPAGAGGAAAPRPVFYLAGPLDRLEMRPDPLAAPGPAPFPPPPAIAPP